MPKLSQADQQAKISQTEATRRKEVALAETREVELAKLKRQLLPAGRVREIWSEHLARMRDRWLSLPDRVCDELAGQPSDVVRAKLYEAVEADLNGSVDEISVLELHGDAPAIAA